MKNKLTTRIFLCFSLALILFSSIVGGIFLYLFTQNTIQTYRTNLIHKTEAIAHTLSLQFENELPNDSFFENKLSSQIKHSNLGLGLYLNFLDDIALSNLWIVDSDTQTIHVEFGKYSISYSSIPTDVRMLIDKAMLGETTTIESWSSSFLKKNFVIATPIIFSDDTVFATVVIHARSKAIYNNIMEAFYALIGSLFLALLVSILPSYLFAHMIVTPLKRMAKATSQMAQGNYNVQTGVNQKDEVGMVAKAIDILAFRLDEASKEHIQLEELRKNYISNISHELRTPVAVLRCSLEALCDGIVTNKEMVHSYHQEMLLEIIHLDRMVNDLLELSRLQSPHYSIEKHTLNFISVIEDAIKTCRHLATKAGHTIVLEKNISLFPFYGDYGRLRQMLVTVLDNAIKFSTPTTAIRIVISGGENHCITSISNFGVGISKDDLLHVFEEYYMQTGESNRTGTGLGLAIAKKIADRHDILLSVSSVADGETTFCFEVFTLT